MVRKLAAAELISGCLLISACNTVRGAAADVNSAANCTEELMKQGRC
jgi:predicted small secreted protein